MESLYREADKLFTDVDHLDSLLSTDDLSEERVELALATAKRVRRQSTILVRTIARIRDQLQPKGGTS